MKRGSQEKRIYYTLKHNFAGYEIHGNFEVYKTLLSVDIKYLEKTPDAQGFGRLFELLESNAKARNCEQINLTVQECKEAVVGKLRKYSERYGWSFGVLDEGNGATGPTLFLQKKVS